MKKYFVSIFVGFILSIGIPAFALAAPSITLTSPNGGETFLRGSTHRITWNSHDVDSVTISLETDKHHEDYIISNIPNIGYYDWTINQPLLTIDNQFKINIIGYQTGISSATDQSDNFFTIPRAPIPLKLTETAHERTWFTGNSQPIQWSGEDLDSTFEILLFPWSEKGVANAIPTAVIAASIPQGAGYSGAPFNMGYLYWTPPSSLATKEYFIRIHCISNCLSTIQTAESKTPIIIAPPVDLKINGSDGPIDVYRGQRINAEWHSESTAFCRPNGLLFVTPSAWGATKKFPSGMIDNKLPIQGSVELTVDEKQIFDESSIGIECEEQNGYKTNDSITIKLIDAPVTSPSPSVSVPQAPLASVPLNPLTYTPPILHTPPVITQNIPLPPTITTPSQSGQTPPVVLNTPPQERAQTGSTITPQNSSPPSVSIPVLTPQSAINLPDKRAQTIQPQILPQEINDNTSTNNFTQQIFENPATSTSVHDAPPSDTASEKKETSSAHGFGNIFKTKIINTINAFLGLIRGILHL